MGRTGIISHGTFQNLTALTLWKDKAPKNGNGKKADADLASTFRETPKEGQHAMILNLIRRLRRDKKGQGLVEYGLLIAGVALISAAAVSLFGHKTSDMIGAVAAVLPGAHQD